MSYCVNCGVEISSALKSCPLCETEVINPKHPYDHAMKGLYPPAQDTLNKNIDRRFLMTLMSILFALPAAISTLVNFLFNGKVTGWSLVVVGGLGVLWVIFCPPLLLTRRRALLAITLDAAAVTAFIALLQIIIPNADWFWPLGLPLVILLYALVCSTFLLISKGVVRGLHCPAIVFFALGIFLMSCEIVTNYYMSGTFSMLWSLLTFACCAALAGVFMTVERKTHLKRELLKRLHI